MLLVVVPTLMRLPTTAWSPRNASFQRPAIVVRGVSSQRATGIDILFRTFGISRAVDDSNAVQAYLLSRDAVRQLRQPPALRAMSRGPGGLALPVSQAVAEWSLESFTTIISIAFI